MANNETIADIIARKRRLAAEMEKSLGDQHTSVEMLKDDADRIEAAHKRERGDCAKLREALLQVIRSMELESGHMCTEKKRLGMHGQTQEDLCKGCRARNAECWTMTLKRECEAALAEKPRNCDVYTADELKAIFKSELVSELPIANEHEKNLITITAMRVIDTLFATAEEGGENAYK